jgi:hypothetical protein
MAADPFAALVALLARLEDELPYVTVDDVCQPGALPLSPTAARALVDAAIADRRLFTDARERLDSASGAISPVRLIRLNRRHPDVAALLDD